MNYFNSNFEIKEDAKRLQRSQKPMKRGKSFPGSRKPISKVSKRAKRLAPALVRWRRACRIRDNYTCQFPGCGLYRKRIDVHHIAKKSRRPDLKFTISNGICLCREHHDWTDTHHDEAVRIGLLNTESYELAKKQERKAA